MRILIVSSTQNSMTQGLEAELAALGHEVALELHGRMASRLKETADAFRPGLIVAAGLTRALPEPVTREHVCVLVEPSVHMDGETCDVLLREAGPQGEASPVIAARRLPPLRRIKAGHYRRLLTEHAVECLQEVIAALSRPPEARGAEEHVARL